MVIESPLEIFKWKRDEMKRNKYQIPENERRTMPTAPLSNVHEILMSMKDTAFQARALGEVYDIVRKMQLAPKNNIFLGCAGSLSSAGFWPLISWLIKNRFVDVVVSTGAIISEDIYEAMGSRYHKVSPRADDKDLLKHKLDRFYDHVADELDYRKMEFLLEGFFAWFNRTQKKLAILPTYKLLYHLGLWLREKNINSILAQAAESKVPVFSPALVDSGYGEAWIRAFAMAPQEERKFIVVDQFAEIEDMLEIAERGRAQGCEKSAIYLGGGVPKDFIQMTAVSQALKKMSEWVCPFKYAVQITMAIQQDGGLSSCGVVDEPISWGKEEAGGENAQVFCDTTIALSLISQGLMASGTTRKNPPDMRWLFE